MRQVNENLCRGLCIAVAVFFGLQMPGAAVAQVEWGSVGKVVCSDGSTGTCFFVETSSGTVEAWTAGHVVGDVGTRCRITVGGNDDPEDSRVIWRNLDRRRGKDAAKLKVTEGLKKLISPLRVNDRRRLFRRADTAGWHFGDRLRGEMVKPATGCGDNCIGFYPAPVQGQSGSPLVIDGFVVGVITERVDEPAQWGGLRNGWIGGRTYGRAKLVDDWINAPVRKDVEDADPEER